jgi:hypothetical protein
VTYDMSVTPMGVIKVAAFGTKPMAIVEGNARIERATDMPTAPLGTPLTVLALIVVIAAGLWILRPREI